MKPIIYVPHSVLTTPAKPVTVFNDQLKTFIEEMKETLIATTNPKGVGLAATQVGMGLRIFITKPTDSAGIRAFINPEIISRSDDVTAGISEKPHDKKTTRGGTSDRNGKLEGCLSIPHIWGRVKRAPALTLRYQDETGKVHQEKFSGFLATIIQHETDHINGVLYTQRVLEQKGKLYQSATDNDGKEVLEEISI